MKYVILYRFLGKLFVLTFLDVYGCVVMCCVFTDGFLLSMVFLHVQRYCDPFSSWQLLISGQVQQMGRKNI